MWCGLQGIMVLCLEVSVCNYCSVGELQSLTVAGFGSCKFLKLFGNCGVWEFKCF